MAVTTVAVSDTWDLSPSDPDVAIPVSSNEYPWTPLGEKPDDDG
jgi:hypothetical protein